MTNKQHNADISFSSCIYEVRRNPIVKEQERARQNKMYLPGGLSLFSSSTYPSLKYLAFVCLEFPFSLVGSE